MKQLFGTLSLLCILFSQNSYETWFKKAEEYLVAHKFKMSIEACDRALSFKPNDPIARALKCLNYYEIGEQLDVDTQYDEKLEIYTKMIVVAEEGIKVAPNSGECYFFRGLGYARLSTTKGIFSVLSHLSDVRDDWLFASETESIYVTPTGEDLKASAYIALGVYYRLTPSFFLLKWIYGIDGDLDLSVAYCKKAYERDPTRIEIVKEYGVSLITRGLHNDDHDEIEEGKTLLAKIEHLPLRLQTDKIDKVHAKMLLADVSLCPGYSRDQQQDISEEAYAKETVQ